MGHFGISSVRMTRAARFAWSFPLPISVFYLYNIHIMRFEWDDDKAARNERNHGVSFVEARGVFDDLQAIEVIDEVHSTAEETRYIRIGLASCGLLFVVFTEPEADVVRIIHARRASKKHESIYEGKEEF